MVGWAGFSHIWLTSVKEGFVIEVIYSTIRVHTKKWNVNMKTKTVSFSPVAINVPFDLQKYWKEYFLIPLIGLNWSVCLTFSVESLGKIYCFSKAESANINSVQSRNQRLRPRPLIQSMIPGFFRLMIYRIGTYLWILLLNVVRVQEGGCFSLLLPSVLCCSEKKCRSHIKYIRASMDIFFMVINS